MTDNEIIAATVRLRECVETLERVADEWRRRALAAEARVRELETPRICSRSELTPEVQP